jgi:hypothetical protein
MRTALFVAGIVLLVLLILVLVGVIDVVPGNGT